MTVRAAWLLPNAQTREDTRLAPVGVLAPEGELLSRAGVIPGGAALAATSAGPMQVQLGIGRAVVQGTLAQGAYPVVVSSPETLTVDDGHPQFDRIDSVVLRVYDGMYDTSGQTRVAAEIIQGTPTATPNPPTLPPAALRLWDVTVPAGASAGVGGLDWTRALADRRQYTTAHGGIIPHGWAMTFNGAYDGQFRDNGVTGLERWNATARAWLPYPYDSGWQPLTLAAGYGNPGHGMPASWRRLGAMVMLRGRIGPTKSGATIANGATIATLPAPIRPAGGREFAWAAPRDVTSKGPALTRVEITGAGVLRTFELFDAPAWISLDGVTYCTD
ncbi:hypothetical protein [Streptomyces orinoci]|uniref:Uncharacterized protein n=1 Tax=Streptomyces orinoci TaxID=67339 RepID=A0ABV3K3F5_STRON|nr:hypothetical protein [Streptomyces orinoci]